MFCENCGNQMPEGAIFCEQCGARLENNMNAEQNAVSDGGNVNIPGNGGFEPPVVKKTAKKLSKKAKISIIAAGVAVVGGLTTLGVLGAPYVQNWFYKTFMPEDKYLQHAVENGTEDFLDGVIPCVGIVKNAFSSESGGAEGKLEVKVGEGFHELLNSQSPETAQQLEWLESVGMNFDGAVNKNTFGTNASVTLNGTDIASLEMVMDMDEGAFYYTLPELNPTSVKMEMEGYSAEEVDRVFEQVEQIAAVIPEDEVIERIITKYLKCAAEQVDDVEEESETVEIKGISQKTTVLTAKITQKTLMKVYKAVLKEAKNDDDIKKIIKDFASLEGMDMDADEVYDQFRSGIDSILESMPSDYDSDEHVDLKIWLNGKGDIIGLGIEYDEVEVFFRTVEKGKKFGVELVVEAEGQSFGMSGSGENNNNKKTGEFNIDFNGMDIVKIAISDIDSNKLKEGSFVGSISIEPTSKASKMLSMAGGIDDELIDLISGLKLKLSATEKTAEISLHTNNKLIASISAEVEKNDNSTVEIPSDYIDINNDSDAAEEWIKNFDITTLIDNLRDAGVPAELLDQMEEGYNSSIAEETETYASGDYYYDAYDDYYYDDGGFVEEEYGY